MNKDRLENRTKEQLNADIEKYSRQFHLTKDEFIRYSVNMHLDYLEALNQLLPPKPEKKPEPMDTSSNTTIELESKNERPQMLSHGVVNYQGKKYRLNLDMNTAKKEV